MATLMTTWCENCFMCKQGCFNIVVKKMTDANVILKYFVPNVRAFATANVSIESLSDYACQRSCER